MEQLLAALPPFVFAQRERLENREDVLFHRHLAEDRFLLRQITHPEPRPLIHRIFRHIRAGKNHAAAVWPNESDDHVKAGRLTGAVRAEEPDDLARAHFDIDAVHDRAPAINLYEPLGRKHVLLGLRLGGGHG